MPNSKKPRHKKKKTAHTALTKYNGLAKIRNMALILDKDHVLNQCIKIMFEFEQLINDDIVEPIWFNKIITMLVTGKVLAQQLPLTVDCQKQALESIEQAAYMLFTSMRIKTKQQPIPPANVDIVRSGLSTAQELFKYAQDNNGDAFLQAIYASMGNENDGVEQHMLRHKYLLGDRWDQIYQWVENNELTFSDDPKLASEESKTANQEGVNHG